MKPHLVLVYLSLLLHVHVWHSYVLILCCRQWEESLPGAKGSRIAPRASTVSLVRSNISREIIKSLKITVVPVLKCKIMFRRNSDSLKFTFLTKNIASESQFQTYELIVAKILKACFITCNCGIRTDFGLKWYK